MMLVSLRFWHGGLFKKMGNKTYYVGGKVKNFEVDSDELCWFWLEELALKCDLYTKIKCIYYLLPGKSLNEGLRKVYNDKEVLEMIDIFAEGKVIDLYVEHGVDEPVILEDSQTKNSPTKNFHSPKKGLKKLTPKRAFQTSSHAKKVKEVPEEYDWEDPRPESPLKWNDILREYVSSDDEEEEYVPLDFDGETDDEDDSDTNDVVVDNVRTNDIDEYGEGIFDEVLEDEGEGLNDGDVQTSDEEFVEARDKVRECNRKFCHLIKELQEEAAEGNLHPFTHKKNVSEGENKARELDEDEDSAEDIPTDSEEDGEGKKKRRGDLVTENTDFSLFKWKAGQRFATRSDFRKAVAKYAVLQGRNLKFDVSDEKRQQRLGVECVKGCPFKLYASWDSRRATFVVKKVVSEHKCNRTMMKNRQLKSTWLAKQFLEVFKAKPHWPAKEIIDTVRRAYKVVILRDFAYKVKYWAHKMLHGSMQDHYSKVGRYLKALTKSSPGTHLVLVNDPKFTTPVLQRLYVCFEGLQKGWKEGCRKIICVDACFLKTFLGGQLMVAVGRDGNDQMYPIAWAIVEGENNLSWEWFLTQLKISLEMGQGEHIAIVSDEHQVIIHAVASVLPLAEHRHCARHIFALWHKTYKGDDMKMKFWKIAKAYNEADYLDALNELEEVDVNAALGFKSYNPKLFCRAFMSTSMKSDTITSNLAETFNGWIINARTKHLIYMLEDIRVSLMQRLVKKRQEMQKSNSQICPRIKAKLEKEKLEAANCEAFPSDDHLFQVTHSLDSLNVNLEAKTCTCRRWDMCGFPCCHAIAAIFFCHREAEEFVDDCYKRDVYLKAYAGSIPPCEGERHWPRIECPLEPPSIKIGPGRPRKNRIKGPHECPKKPGKLTRHGIEMTCSICQTKGHNKRRCPNKFMNVELIPRPKKHRSDGVSQVATNVEGEIHKTATAQPTMLGRGGRVIRGGLGSRSGGGGLRGTSSKGTGGKGGGSRRGGGRRGGRRGGCQLPAGFGVFICDDGATMLNDLGSSRGPMMVNTCSISDNEGPLPSQASSSIKN